MYKIMNKVMVGISIVLIIILCLYIYFANLKHSCDNWGVGNHGHLINEGKLCKMEKPDICFGTAIEGLLNFAKFGDCDSRKGYSKDKLEQYYLTNKTFIGLAKTN